MLLRAQLLSHHLVDVADSSVCDGEDEDDEDTSSEVSEEIGAELTDWNGQLSLSWQSIASGEKHKKSPLGDREFGGGASESERYSSAVLPSRHFPPPTQ